MNKLNLRFIKHITLFLLFANLAFAADPITVIQYPLTMRPAILQAGDSFTILCKAPGSTTNWQAKLFTDYNEVNLPVNPVYDSNTQLWSLSANVPSGTPFELYHLQVSADGINDQVTHAVKIIQEFKNNYYFVHIPDMHLPSVSWIGYYDDNNTVPEFLKIARELQIINPEFILQTGDVVDNGQDEQHYRIAQELIEQLQNPVFITGGNHDLWYDGHTNWHTYFNPVMNFSFNYGDHHFSGLEMYDIPNVTFTTEQVAWLQSDLQNSLNSTDKLRTLFYHYDESRQIDADFVDNYQIDLILYGHTHINGVTNIGTRQALNLNTSFTMNDNGEYRIVKIANNHVQEYPVISFKKLTVDYSPANDGSSWRVKAHIENKNPVGFENGLIKFLVRKDGAGYQVSGGKVAQVIQAADFDVYYVDVAIQANSVQDVIIESLNPASNFPPEILTQSPPTDTTIYAGLATPFSITASDPENAALNYKWLHDGQSVQQGSSASYDFTPDPSFTGLTYLTVQVSDGDYYDEHTWMLEVEPFTDRPVLLTSVVNFFPHNESMTLEWFEPFAMNARLEYGLSPGIYTGSVSETGSHSVSFTPELVGMGLGLYYCQITDGSVSSDPFTIIIESPNAAQMLAPLGNIQSLSPIFSWEKVPGVPYYMVICSDQEILIKEDPQTGEITVEGANPIWAVLTSENSVPYGIPDPSGTFTSVPAPLIAGNSYWWVVLNCYGNAAELTSPVQSGISKFTIDLPPPDLNPPVLLSPEHNSTLAGETITFRWQGVPNATTYHFYPFKIEQESGIETARAIWENIIATTNEAYEFPAGNMLVEGKYRWKVAAVADNGMEVHSESRDFYYQAPSAIITIKTYDSKNTDQTGDDSVLPRVKITYSAIDGIYNGLPLSTDLHGVRENYKIAPGVYSFLVEKENYDNIVDTLTFLDGQTYNLSFRLHPSKSRLTGKVNDNSGESVSDATVKGKHTLHPEITKTTQTDALGNFSLSLIPGTYQIQAQKTGYENSSSVSVSVSSGEVKALESPISITKNTNSVAGTVVNTARQGVLGVQVLLFNSSLQFVKITNASGHFDFIVPNGTWTLRAAKEGFVSPPNRQISVSGGATISVSPPLTLTPNAGIIQGQVFDGFHLVADAVIKASPAAGSPFETRSDGYGQFSLNLPSGIYSISAEKSGYTFSQSIQVTLNAGETQSGVEVLLKPVQSVIRGKVTTDGFNPVAGATIFNASVSALTSESGAFELGVDYGTHIISAMKEGYTSSPPETLAVAPGQVVEQVNFILTPNASVIKGRITGPGGGIAGATIIARNSISLQTKSDENGYYVINGTEGSWVLTVSREGFLSAEKEDILIGVGQTLSGINFHLTPNITTINGKITDKTTHQPLSNAEIKLKEKNLSTSSNVEGMFSLSVEPGNYTLEVTKAGYRPVSENAGELTPNSTKEINFALEELHSSFTGRIFDQNNLPQADAFVFAISGSDTFRTNSLADGSFRLDVKAGVYQVSALKSGYKEAVVPETQTINAGESKSLPTLVLVRNLGGIIGAVVQKQGRLPVANARIQAVINSVLLAQTLSQDDGSFRFVNESGQPILIPGVYDLIASKAGFVPDTLGNVTVTGGGQTAVQFELAKNLGQISGTVESDVGPVAGATVSGKHRSTHQLYNSISGENGRFNLSGLPQGNYQIHVAKTGYTSPADSVVTVGSVIQLYLIKNDGRIFGTISDVETAQPLAGVTISVDDRQGNYGKGYSNSSGHYEISELPKTFPYYLTVGKGGYQTQTFGPVALSDSTHLDFQLQRIYGSISGRAVDQNQAGLTGVIISLSSSVYSATDTTGADGHYEFNHLPAHQYKLTAAKIGYKSDPVQQIVSLWQGGDVENVQFVMKEAVAAIIEIVGPDNISNASTQQYAYSAVTSDQREASILPHWEVNLPDGIDNLSQTGLLDPNDQFFGVIELKLTDLHSGIFATKAISVHQVVNLGHATLNLTNEQGITLVLQDSSVVQNIVIQLRKLNFADVRRSTKSFQIVGEIYEFTPASFSLLKPAELSLPVPEEAQGEQLFIGKWNTQWLEWKTIPGQPAGNNQLRTTIEQLGRYAVLVKSEPLGIKNIRISPNPFSPQTGPVQIDFEVSSNQTPQPLVSVKIYNMIGDLIKTLLRFEPRLRGMNQLFWDGMTDSNRMAKNGRYILHFQVKDITGTKEKLVPFVLIK